MKLNHIPCTGDLSLRPFVNIDNAHFYENLVNIIVPPFILLNKQVILPLNSYVSLCKCSGTSKNSHVSPQVVKVLYLQMICSRFTKFIAKTKELHKNKNKIFPQRSSEGEA